jgi:single-stranded-DNA-specific exonuclease
MKDIDLASDRIVKAVKNNEKIMIFGHDDLDGITSTYILFDFLSKIGSQNHYFYIPNRNTDNHGMQDGFIRLISEEKIDLLITVDGGISDFHAVERINETGCNVIITDHHQVQSELPDALAIMNPRQQDCNYPYDMLAGVGVVYMLILNLGRKLNFDIDKNYLFWVSVGSIADKVPMTGVNRILVKKVLDEWSSFNDSTLRMILNNDQYPVNHTARMGIIRYIIKLLSNGRKPRGENLIMDLLLRPIGEKEKILQKLLSDFEIFESRISKLRFHLNTLTGTINEDYYIYFDDSGLIPDDLLGFSAAFLASSLKIPVIMLSQKGDIVSCEARCTDGFNLIDAFKFCSESLIQYGGHIKAAGFTIEPEKVPLFKKKFIEYVEGQSTTINENKKITVDAVFKNNDLDSFKDFLQTDFHFLQPYGENNPSPYYLLRNFSKQFHWQNLKIDNSSQLSSEGMFHLILKFNGFSLQIVDYEQIQ